MPFVAAIVGATAILAGGASVAPPAQPGPWTQVGAALTSAKPGKALHFYRAVVSPKAIGVVARSSSVGPIRVWPGPVTPPISEDELEAFTEKVAAEGKALVPEGVPVSVHTAAGHVGTELLKRAAAADHDLIVMGSRGRGAISSAVLGSSSHFVLNHATVPVLIIHERSDGSAVT